MNVLPLVSTFLLIFAICSYTFVHSLRTAIEEKFHFTGSFRIHRKFGDLFTSEAYTIQRAQNLHPQAKKPKQDTKPEGPYCSPRDWFKKRPESKCNLRPFLEVGNHTKLENCVLTLLRDLYGLAYFYRPELEKEILDTLLETLKENKTLACFEALLKQIPEEKVPLFYKLCRGTQKYKLQTTQGFPPLSDFFTIAKINPNAPPIQFYHCSSPILTAVFGPQLAPLIMNEEKHKWENTGKHEPLSKQELESFLSARQYNPADFLAFFSFNAEKHPVPYEVIHDLETHIQIKLEK